MATRVKKRIRVSMELEFGIEDITPAVVERYIKGETEGLGLEEPITGEDIAHQKALMDHVLRNRETVDTLMVEHLNFFADGEVRGRVVEECVRKLGEPAGRLIFQDFMEPHFKAMEGDAYSYFNDHRNQRAITSVTNIFLEAITLDVTRFQVEIADRVLVAA